MTLWRKLIYNYIPLVQVRYARVTRPFYFSGRRRIKGSATPDYMPLALLLFCSDNKIVSNLCMVSSSHCGDSILSMVGPVSPENAEDQVEVMDGNE